ncbi:PDP protein [Sulfurimonas sp. SAG-AH-194-C21]|nr:PDP protein [Sulfurimonas sp. SAG-AH-194-C21]MDF1882951.1 PDP protein [Sulfurimonas sp. SAG-AH-194-C21]
MKLLLLIALFTSSLFSLQTSDRLFECTEIFKERKNELLVELERIDEQKQALSALKIATEELLKQKGEKLSIQEEEVDAKLADIMEKEKSIKKMMQKNEAALKELKSTKMSKIAQTFSKMKPAAASGILSDMDAKDAMMILQSLKPKVVGKILTKMDAKKASELTQLLSK